VLLAAVNTTLRAATGAISGMFTSTIIDQTKTGLFQYDTAASINGCLTSLVAITAGCATIEHWAAFVIGIAAGWIYLGVFAFRLKCKIDDAVDAIPVHLFGGAWGIISTGLFSNEGRMEAAAYLTEKIGW
jgi:Amt family ammonium transporter